MTVSDTIRKNAKGGELAALIEWTRDTQKPQHGNGPSADFLLREAESHKTPSAFCDVAEACASATKPFFEQNLELAELWYRKAVSTGAGSAFAADRLGDLCARRQDYDAAVNFYITARGLRDEYASLKLALMAIFGLGLRKDVGTAFAELNILAKRSNTRAMQLLRSGICDPEFAGVLLGERNTLTSVTDIEEHFTQERKSQSYFAGFDNGAPMPTAAPKPTFTYSAPQPQPTPPPAQNAAGARPPPASRIIEAPGLGAPPPFDELNALIGLGKAKKSLKAIANQMKFMQERKRAGLPGSKSAQHFVFSGNPGTGKTTVARILGRILKEIGFLEKGHVVECAAQDLIGEYVGQTAPRVAAQVQAAIGGVLFIDEAYSLLNARGATASFTEEAIATLLKLMEDRRDEFTVVAAGYPKLMQDFVNANPGLKSRFTEFVEFDDYTPQELEKIYLTMVAEYRYELEPAARPLLTRIMTEAPAVFAASFSNARFVRSFFEDTVKYMANRVMELDAGTSPTATHAYAQLTIIAASDLTEAWQEARSAVQEEEKPEPLGFHA